jgi:hypothetical protein
MRDFFVIIEATPGVQKKIEPSDEALLLLHLLRGCVKD